MIHDVYTDETATAALMGDHVFVVVVVVGAVCCECDYIDGGRAVNIAILRR